jgi:hypothetical protein
MDWNSNGRTTSRLLAVHGHFNVEVSFELQAVATPSLSPQHLYSVYWLPVNRRSSLVPPGGPVDTTCYRGNLETSFGLLDITLESVQRRWTQMIFIRHMSCCDGLYD